LKKYIVWRKEMEAKPFTHPLFIESPRISERVVDLKPYDPVSSLDTIRKNPNISHYKLDWNETTIQPSPKVSQALLDFVSNSKTLNWYPEMHYQKLYQKLADYVGCRMAQILVTNGSDDALSLLCQTYLDSTDNIVSPVPTYNHFLQFAQLVGAEVRRVQGQTPFLTSLADVAEAIDENTKIVYLANPNNPTGTLYPPAEILQLAQSYPNVLIISDEAYYEFAGISAAKIIDEVENVVVTRSFSKCFGLASLRIGYLAAPEKIVTDLRRVFNPKSVNMMAQIAAVAALDDMPYYRNYIRDVKRAANLTKKFCDQRNIPCRATYGNFILIQVENAPTIAKKLAEVGIHIRDRSKHLPNVLRISLGTEKQMEDILSRLAKVLDENQSSTLNLAEKKRRPSK
jgi:histidinol-phosphate aminotransferase